MPQGEFIRRSHVQNSHRTGAHSRQKLLAGHRLQFIALAEIAANNAVDFSDIALSDAAHGRKNVENAVIGEGVIDKLALTPGCQQASAPHVLEVLRSICNRQAGPVGEHFNAALALCKLFQQLKAMRMPERFRDGGKLRK